MSEKLIGGVFNDPEPAPNLTELAAPVLLMAEAFADHAQRLGFGTSTNVAALLAFKRALREAEVSTHALQSNLTKQEKLDYIKAIEEAPTGIDDPSTMREVVRNGGVSVETTAPDAHDALIAEAREELEAPESAQARVKELTLLNDDLLAKNQALTTAMRDLNQVNEKLERELARLGPVENECRGEFGWGTCAQPIDCMAPHRRLIRRVLPAEEASDV